MNTPTNLAAHYATPWVVNHKIPYIIFIYYTRFGTGFCFTVVYAALLTKTNRISRIFNASKHSAKRPILISPSSQLCICAGLVSIQVSSGFFLSFEGCQMTTPVLDNLKAVTEYFHCSSRETVWSTIMTEHVICYCFSCVLFYENFKIPLKTLLTEVPQCSFNKLWNKFSRLEKSVWLIKFISIIMNRNA